MTDRLDEIRARTEAATPGPWRAYGNTVEQEKTGCHQVVGTEFTGWGYMAHERLTTKDEDATFIANARNDIPYLLAEIERLRSALEGCAGDGCWAVTVPDCLTEFPMDPAEWCPACIAIAALTEGGES